MSDQPLLPPILHPSSDDKLWAVLCHVSLFLGVGILLPLIVWLVKKDDSPVVAAHACEALNFHVSLYLYAFVGGVLGLLLCISFLLVAGVGLFGMICAILAAVEASKGGFFRYPLTIPFFR